MITANTDNEMIYCMILMFLGVSMFSFILAQLTQLIVSTEINIRRYTMMKEELLTKSLLSYEKLAN